MSCNRRSFIKIAGLAAAAVAGNKAIGSDYVPKPWLESGGLTAKRWAMAIDLKKCREKESCTDCINACHLAHNVPHFDNPKHEIKWIWKESFEHAFHGQEHEHTPEDVKHGLSLVMCNHCENPPCVRVCPTQSTWKRESDGIVMMDWHRCIGCRYCVVACPYGSRSFNWRDPREGIANVQPDFPTRMRGVVEKCTFCDERLAKGLLPACVEACKEHAMVFGDLDDPSSDVCAALKDRFSIRRKPELGTGPEIYYIV
jgi:molybdopterin-containing oxidoreductase family iron-sulfur binding subunit